MTAILAFLTSLFPILGKLVDYFTQSDERDLERDAGVTSGVAQQKAADEAAELARANATIQTERDIAANEAKGGSIDDAIQSARDGQL
ncbi:MAG: hypothetical protein KGL39_04655 [Patescibacteria group bacterium]|nr:hypothetical protein [Patescibacteria group bacterium]